MAQAFLSNAVKVLEPLFRPITRSLNYLEWAFPEAPQKAAFAFGTAFLVNAGLGVKSNWYPEKPFMPIKPQEPLQRGPDEPYPFILPTEATFERWISDPDQVDLFLEWADEHPDNLDKFMAEQFGDGSEGQ